jgi:hypothetical protein
MKSLCRMCAVAALTCVFTVSICAGEMSAGIVNPPPSQPAVTTGEATQPGLETKETDETNDGVVEIVLTLLNVLSVL